MLLLGTDVRRGYLSATVGSVHQLAATENRRAGELLRDAVPDDRPVMSWHPAVALHARRDWRVLPFGDVSEIVRYARAIACDHVVLSYYNPSPLEREQFPRPYLLVRVPDDAPAAAGRWTIRVDRARGNLAIGRLIPVGP